MEWCRSNRIIMNNIKSIEQIDELINNSDNNPVIFFKHSLTCPISARAYAKVSEALKNKIIQDDLIYLVIVPAQRNFSNYIAEKTGVIHESPQIIVIKNKQVIYNDSHDAIDINMIVQSLDN